MRLIKRTAKELAVKYGHTSVDSCTTVRTEVNPDADTDDGHKEMMDLRVCGVGNDAFLEWVTEQGDPIGDLLDEVEVEDAAETIF